MAAIIESFYTAFITTEAEGDEIPFNEALPDGEHKLHILDAREKQVIQA